jgi:hypothetical protein
VRVERGFWHDRIVINRHVTIPALLERLREHHVLDNFRRLYGAVDRPRERRLATDSDLYKWLEGACYAIANEPDAELKGMIDGVIDVILPAQEESGYLNTAMVEENRARRWQDFHAHELYCAGHLFQAAVAHHRATGEGRLLATAIKLAAHLWELFGPGKREWHPGHPEAELALVELYRESRDRRYLDLAGLFLKRCVTRDPDEIWGHAVRALYYDSGAADYVAETGDEGLRRLVEAHWRTLTSGKMYVTGGVGSRHHGECMGPMFDLPNLQAYAETCAAAANVFFNWRMLMLTAQAQFAGILETALYNGFLAGVSLDGRSFFYVNPLACTGRGFPEPWAESVRTPPYQRSEFFATTCCPPNVVRLIASVPGLLYSLSEDGVVLNLYADSALDFTPTHGPRTTLRQSTDYPWDGRVEVEVLPEETVSFCLSIRIPEWTPRARIEVNGIPWDGPARPGCYAALERSWEKGDVVTISFDMPPQFLECDERVTENRNSVALRRGPIVYCFEGKDNPGVDLFDVQADTSAPLEVRPCDPALGNMPAITIAGCAPTRTCGSGALYRPLGNAPRLARRDVTLMAIPYYAWANRGPSQMTVWALRKSST